jgi:hypothetical protein
MVKMSMMKEGPFTWPTAVQLCTVHVYIIVNSFIAVGCVEGPSFDILTGLYVLRIPVDITSENVGDLTSNRP